MRIIRGPLQVTRRPDPHGEDLRDDNGDGDKNEDDDDDMRMRMKMRIMLMSMEVHFRYFLFPCSVPLDQLPNKRIALFSYGSGMASSLYSIRVAKDASPGSPLAKVRNSLNDLEARLESRRCVKPGVFADTMKLREDTHHLGW